MPLLSLNDARSLARASYGNRTMVKTAAKSLLEEERKSSTTFSSFDVFLSHSYKDATVDNEVLLGISRLFSQFNYVIYVDWIVDKELSREDVSSDTAERLRYRMRQSKSLLFVTSTNSASSKWMPWELGYFDGYKGRVGILPLTGGSASGFQGQEYLGLYPMLDYSVNLLWMHNPKSPDKYVRFSDWLNGSDP